MELLHTTVHYCDDDGVQEAVSSCSCFQCVFLFLSEMGKKKKERDDHNFNNCYTKIALNNCIAMPKNLHLTFK